MRLSRVWVFHTKKQIFLIEDLMRLDLTTEEVLAIVITQGCIWAVEAKFQLFRRWRLKIRNSWLNGKSEGSLCCTKLRNPV